METYVAWGFWNSSWRPQRCRMTPTWNASCNRNRSRSPR